MHSGSLKEQNIYELDVQVATHERCSSYFCIRVPLSTALYFPLKFEIGCLRNLSTGSYPWLFYLLYVTVFQPQSVVKTGSED